MSKDLLVLKFTTPLPHHKFVEGIQEINRLITPVLEECNMECVMLPHNIDYEIHSSNKLNTDDIAEYKRIKNTIEFDEKYLESDGFNRLSEEEQCDYLKVMRFDKSLFNTLAHRIAKTVLNEND